MTPTLPETCESLLAAMIGFDTVNHNISGKRAPEVDLAVYLEGVADAMGFDTQRLPLDDHSFNLLVIHEADPAAPWILFESHLDTVAVEGMTIDPFNAQIRDGRIYGRGACDTKGTGAAMLWALKQYADVGDGANNVAIAYTTDEEISKTGVHGLTDKHLPAMPWKPVGAVIGEPTMLEPIIAHNGIVRWKVHTRGIAAHSGDPAKGKSAISMMMWVIDTIENAYARGLTQSHPLTGRAQCSVNVIHGGVQVNIIPEHCEIEVDRRTVPGEDGGEVVSEVEKLLDKLRQADPDLVVEQKRPYIDPPLSPAGGEAFVEIVQKTLAKAGLPPAARGAHYGTDASQFPEIGIPALVIGPGDIAQGHTKDEWLALEQLELGVDVYHRLISADWKSIA